MSYHFAMKTCLIGRGIEPATPVLRAGAADHGPRSCHTIEALSLSNTQSRIIANVKYDHLTLSGRLRNPLFKKQ